MKMCCSKKILLTSYVVTILLTVACVYAALAVEGVDLTALVTLAGFAWAETTAATAFYYWKARTENKIKLTELMVESMADRYGIDAVVRFAEINLTDN